MPEAAKTLAVLELRSRLAVLDTSRLDLLYLTDRIRTAALRAGPSLNVVSRENLVVLLQASGKTMEQFEGECDVETGRLVGADLVVSGEALTVDGSFKLSLKLHATKNGRMLSGSVASGTSFDELDGDVPRAVFELLRPVLGADAVLSPVVEKPKAKRTSSSESLFDPQSMCHGELALRGVAYGISGRSVKWDGRSVVSRTFFCVNAAGRVEGPLVVAGWLGFIVQGWCIVDANAPAARFQLEGVFHFDGAPLPPDRQADFASTAVSDFCAASQAAVLTGEAVQQRAAWGRRVGVPCAGVSVGCSKARNSEARSERRASSHCARLARRVKYAPQRMELSAKGSRMEAAT